MATVSIIKFKDESFLAVEIPFEYFKVLESRDHSPAFISVTVMFYENGLMARQGVIISTDTIALIKDGKNI